MMRSPRFFAVACRKPDQTIIVKTEPVEHSIVGKLKWLNRPFLRGTLALVDAMALGTKALAFSASVQAESIGPPDESKRGSSRINDIAIGGAMVFAICFGLCLF